MTARRPSSRSPASAARRRQRAASDPSLSAWIAASAGTGKTKVLTDRVLGLLLGGTKTERILCLTFTSAAAAEMAIRVERQLGQWAVLTDRELDAVLHDLTGATPDDALRSRARRLFAETLDAPGGLKIMTIHAFCQSLLRRFPLEARIAPHFEVMDERTAAERLTTAQHSVLARARGGDARLEGALADLAPYVRESRFAELMGQVAAVRGRLNTLLARHRGLDDLPVAVRGVLGVAPEESAESVVAEACVQGSFDRPGLARAAKALAEGSPTDQAHGARIAAWLDAGDERAALFDDYLGVYLTQKGEPRKTLATKDVRAADPEAEGILRQEQARLQAVVERRNAAAVARATSGLLRLGVAMLEAYDKDKVTRARLDYDDLILAAGDLLERPGVAPWVLYKLDGGVDHILVDEAQDTSPDQWRVIAALVEEFFAGEGGRETDRTLFVVSDEKQSIFSFQGADLEALEAMREHFRRRAAAAGRVWKEWELDRSFRSTQTLLGAVDRVFAGEATRDGVAFGERSIRHEPTRHGQAGLVEVWPPVVPAEPAERTAWEPPLKHEHVDDPPARLATGIAGTIRRWLDRGERLESRGRPIQPGDIMILLYHRAPLADLLVRELKARDVPVAGTDRIVLNDQLAVMDLVSLGEFLLFPEDDLTLATVLKGPLVGLDEDGLFALAHERGPHSLWRTLTRRCDEREAFTRARDYLAGLLDRADYMPPFELYGQLLGAPPAHGEALNGRAAVLRRLGMDAADPIDEFLSLALAYEALHPPSLQGFLHWLVAGRTEVKREAEVERDEVRVRTVHGAKGLEAPIVILPDTMRLPPRDKARLVEREGDGGVLLWAPRRELEEASCRASRAAQERREEQEYRRLLYVALTRAEDRLYIAGWHGPNRPPEGCWYDLVRDALGDVAAPFDFEGSAPGAWSGEGLRLVDPQTKPPEEKKPVPGRLPPPTELPAFVLKPAPAEPRPPRPLAPSRPAAPEPPAGSPLAGVGDRAPALKGRLVHRLFELLPEIAPKARAEACRRLIAHPAHGLDRGTQATLAERVLAILDDPRFAPLFAPSSGAEVPLIGRVGDVVIAGQVDRLLVDEDEILVVDFKTNRPPPRSEAEVPPTYLKQMAAYRAVLSQIYPERPVRCALMWTEGPTLMPLSDTSLAAHAP